ncbi:MAG TPA: tRNA (adenosine(37)-N6)-threonylcarbamoyltransferase complex dimerization subunit type 1 TsaB [Kofleriaceae bacterium]|nr:tRNA (adenosine(37)-N6)-threonylcarbamoyltransferase complex dimerization subunit type 1 TsaB [Kofleriaceae bacterium]
MEWRGEYGRSPVLALDTSTDVASVAVLGPACDITGEGRAASRSDDLIPLIDRALADAGARLGDLAAIAVGAGPGSFTGLRIGMATAKGLCFATGLPLWSASSLAALALDAAAIEPLDGALVVAAFDARRDELGAGFYRVDGDRAEPMADERIVEPARLAAAVADILRASGLSRAVIVGDALSLHGAALAAAGAPLSRARVTPSARSVARLALAGPRIDVLQTGTPVYIRPSAAEVAFPDGNPGTRLLARRDDGE